MFCNLVHISRSSASLTSAFVMTGTFFSGFLKLGVTLALINFNQRSKTLLHSLIVASAKYIVVGEGK